jgi:uncharacterized protein with NRDE domain
LLRDKKINVLVLTALEKSAEFPGAPAVVDLVAKQEDRQLLELFAGIDITRLSGECGTWCGTLRRGPWENYPALLH